MGGPGLLEGSEGDLKQDPPERPTSYILDHARMPADWVMVLAEKGIMITQRTLRERANRIGACYKIGRAMLITPEQMDVIVRAGAPNPRRSDRTNQPGLRRENLTEAARAHLKAAIDKAKQEKRAARAARSRQP